MRTEKVDIYAEITNQIIEAVEAGAENYQMPWHVNGADSVLPVNASTHRPYRGVNVMMLWAVAAKKEYATSLWATYQQWRELSAQVRKGEKSTPVVFWKFFHEEGESEASEATERDHHRGVMARAYHVFQCRSGGRLRGAGDSSACRNGADRTRRAIFQRVRRRCSGRWIAGLLFTRRRLYSNASVCGFQESRFPLFGSGA